MIYKSKYGSYKVELRFNTYANGGNCAILLVDDEGSPVTDVTSNFPGCLAIDETAVRNHSENEGMLEWLLSNKFVAPPHRYIKSGYVEYPVCKLLIDPKDYK